MFEFIKNTIVLFLGFIFVAIPMSIIVLFLLLKFLTFCGLIAGAAGVFFGLLLLMSMMFASMIY